MPTWRRWRRISLSASSTSRPCCVAEADKLTGDVDPAAVYRLQSVDAAQKGALSRPGRTDEAHHLADGELEGYPFEDVEAAEALPYALRDHHRHRLPGSGRVHRRLPKPLIRARHCRCSAPGHVAAGEVALDVVLPDREHADHEQIPEARDD